MYLENYTNEFNLQNRNRLTDLENKFMVTEGKSRGGGINEEVGINICILLHMVDNQQGSTVQHKELYSIFCNNLYGKRI